MPTARQRITDAATAAGWTVAPVPLFGRLVDENADRITRGAVELRAWYDARGTLREYAHRIGGEIAGGRILGRDKAGHALAVIAAPVDVADLDDAPTVPPLPTVAELRAPITGPALVLFGEQ